MKIYPAKKHGRLVCTCVCVFFLAKLNGKKSTSMLDLGGSDLIFFFGLKQQQQHAHHDQSSKRLHNLHNLVVPPHLKVLWKLKLRIGCYSCWFLKHFSTSWKGLRRVGGGGGGGRGEVIDHPQKKLKMHAQDRFSLQQEAWQSFFLLFENNNNNNVLIWSDLIWWVQLLLLLQWSLIVNQTASSFEF